MSGHRLIPEAVLERTLGVLLDDEELYRFRVVKLISVVKSRGASTRSSRRGRVFESPHRRLKAGEYDKVLNGEYPVSGKNADGSLRIGEGEEGAEVRDEP